MLAIELVIHVLWLPLVIAISVMAGMLFRIVQLKKFRKQVLFLESEMMNNHAEILKLQQKLAPFEKSSAEITTPVVPIKEQANEDNDKPDVTQHKKVN